MIIDESMDFALRRQYEQVYNAEKLKSSLEERIRGVKPHLVLESKQDSIHEFIKLFGQDKYVQFLKEGIFERVSKGFTESTMKIADIQFPNYKHLFRSKPEDMLIFTNNELGNHRIKTNLIKEINIASNIDTSIRPLVLMLRTLRECSTFYDELDFTGDKQILVYQEQPFYKPNPGAKLTTYANKDDFFSDVSELIKGLDPKNTNRYFNLLLMTHADSKTTPPEQELSIAI